MPLHLTPRKTLCTVIATEPCNVKVVSYINFVKNRVLTYRQFKEFLNDLHSEHGDLIYYCEVCWPSRGNMLRRFYELRDVVKQFMG